MVCREVGCEREDLSGVAAGSGMVLPSSPQDWLPEGHLVYFLMDAVRELDISAITSHYERELRGFPPFHSGMMLTLLIFNYATGTRSSRKIMQRCEQDVACRVIVGEDTPACLRRKNTGTRSVNFVVVTSPRMRSCSSKCCDWRRRRGCSRWDGWPWTGRRSKRMRRDTRP